jgi:hypothetical protein
MDALWKRIQPVTKHIRLYSLIVLMLWGGFTVVNAGMVTLSGVTLQPADPFADYEAILPGQIRHALNAYEFTCNAVDARYAQTNYCIYKPTTGTFSLVEVLIDQDDKITEVDFTLRDSLFRVGDLMLLWGKPSIHPHPTSINFIWTNGAGATTQYSRHISFSLDVQKVYFMLHKETIRPIPIDKW